MEKKKSAPRQIYPSYRGNFVVRESRGIAVASRWPRKRPSPRHPTNEYWSEWLKQAMLLYTALPGEFRRELDKAGRGMPQMPRDLAVASMRGTLWSYATTEGFTRYSMATYSRVSASLDVLAQLPGSMLVRGADLWSYVPASDAGGKILTWDAATGLPTWQTPGAEAGYTPPAVADFATLVGTPAPTLEQATSGPLVLRRTPAGAATALGAALRALAAPPMTYTFGLRALAQNVTGRRVGIVLRDSATGRMLACLYLYITITSQPILRVERWTDLVTSGIAMTSMTTFPTSPIFIRIHDDGTNFRFDYSADLGNWATLSTQARTSWVANPDQIGIAIASAAAEGFDSTVAVLHYNEA